MNPVVSLFITALLVATHCSGASLQRQDDSLDIAKRAIDDYPESCADAYPSDSGIKLILPQPGFGEPIEVYCDQDWSGGGWTVIQRRLRGSVYFYRGWADYEDGFGNVNGDFWLGLKRIHEMTYSKRHELLVVLNDSNGYSGQAIYNHFLVAGPEAHYKLERLGNYTGTAGDSLSFHLGADFGTFDSFVEPAGETDDEGEPDDGGEPSDEGVSGEKSADKVSSNSRNCAEEFKSGWWYTSDECFESDLNGLFWESETGRGVNWVTFRGNTILKATRIMIRAIFTD